MSANISTSSVLRSAIIIALTAFMSLQVAAQSKLLGRVTDDGGRPLSAVMVSISGQAATQAAFSNAEGYYVILGVPPGDYTLKTAKKGMPGWKNQVNLASGATKRVDIQIGGEGDEKALLAAATKKKEEQRKEEQRKEERREEKLADARHNAEVKQEAEKVASVGAPKPPTETKPSADELALQKAISEAAEIATEAATNTTDAEVVGGIKTVYQKLQYPEIARRQKMQGQVIAKVYLGKDGSVAKIELLKQSQEFFNDEVFRTLTEEVSYKPATMGGHPVPSALVIPVKFELK
jgi:TonB family protein